MEEDAARVEKCTIQMMFSIRWNFEFLTFFVSFLLRKLFFFLFLFCEYIHHIFVCAKIVARQDRIGKMLHHKCQFPFAWSNYVNDDNFFNSLVRVWLSHTERINNTAAPVNTVTDRFSMLSVYRICSNLVAFDANDVVRCLMLHAHCVTHIHIPRICSMQQTMTSIHKSSRLLSYTLSSSTCTVHTFKAKQQQQNYAEIS